MLGSTVVKTTRHRLFATGVWILISAAELAVPSVQIWINKNKQQVSSKQVFANMFEEMLFQTQG